MDEEAMSTTTCFSHAHPEDPRANNQQNEDRDPHDNILAVSRRKAAASLLCCKPHATKVRTLRIHQTVMIAKQNWNSPRQGAMPVSAHRISAKMMFEVQQSGGPRAVRSTGCEGGGTGYQEGRENGAKTLATSLQPAAG